MSSQNFLNRALLLLSLPMAAGAVGLGYGLAVEPTWFELKHVDIRAKQLTKDFDGYRIAQISDLHLGPFNQAEKIGTAVKQLQASHPDLIVLTGDFVSTLEHGEAEVLATELAHLSAPDGVYAILGNHDLWTDSEIVTDALQRAGVCVLENNCVAIERGEGRFYLAGVGDVMEARADLCRALRGVPENAQVVLLAHEPDYADLAARDERIFLQLSGHVHGGQVRLPGLPPFTTPPWGNKYTDGLFTIRKMQLYVNRGLGVSFPPVRLFCRPEITLVTLRTQ